MLKTAAFSLLLFLSNLVQAGQATVAAAATLRPALEEIAPSFERETGHSLTRVYGSSGNFYTQIRQGAPFDFFMSADMLFPQKLVDEKRAVGPVTVYGEGRLVLLLPKASPLKPDASLSDVANALKDGRLRKLAIANPAVAPYGMRAREVLEQSGLWAKAQPRLVVGENVGQATQFVTSGAAQAGLVALSLALAPGVPHITQHVLIPRQMHQPLLQGMVILRQSNPVARSFYIHLQSEEARAVLKKYGYDKPILQ